MPRLLPLLEKKVLDDLNLYTQENIELVEEMILSQEVQPGTHSAPPEIGRKLNVDCRSVSRIIDQDRDLRPLRKRKVNKLSDSNIEKRMIRSRKLLPRYIQKTLQTAFCSDKKILKVKQLYNSHNDVIDVPKKMRNVVVPEERL